MLSGPATPRGQGGEWTSSPQILAELEGKPDPLKDLVLLLVLPALRFSDLPTDLVMMITVLTVILKPTQSFQKAEAENFLRMTVLVPKRILEHVATCPPEEWYRGR